MLFLLGRIEGDGVGARFLDWSFKVEAGEGGGLGEKSVLDLKFGIAKKMDWGKIFELTDTVLNTAQKHKPTQKKY